MRIFQNDDQRGSGRAWAFPPGSTGCTSFPRAIISLDTSFKSRHICIS